MKTDTSSMSNEAHPQDDDPMWSIKVEAQKLNTSVRHVRRLIKSGALAHHRIGRVIRIRRSDHEEFCRRNRHPRQE